jgi:predicted dehydrogenase
MNQHLPRRRFIRQSAAAAAAITIVPAHLIGCKGVKPSDKIRLGFIGTGKLMSDLFRSFAGLEDVIILAGCDVDSKKLERFKNNVKQFYADRENPMDIDIDTYHKYEELLARDDIDAVVVGTPDHWHAIISIAAMKAGKDVYCEKPLAHTVVEGRAMVNTAREHERILQTGSMQRSWNDFRKACELVINGYAGEISKVIVNVGDPARACDLPGEPEPYYLDWNRWVGPAQLRPYSPVLAPPIENTEWPMWRDYREFGGGILADWGAHMFDIAQWGLGMDNSGPVRLIPPGDPQAVRGLTMYYENGIELVHEDFGRGWAVRFIGSEGSLDVSREFLDSKPETIALQEIQDSYQRLYFSDNHYANWINCIKSRKNPVADVEIGHRSATICNIANIAYWLRRPLQWDPVKEVFNDDEADRLLTKDYREPYLL